MLNPHSAISRIKNQLAYKLGSYMIEHNANGGGYLSLIYKLYKIKKEYSKERKIYKQTTKIFPNLIYPDVKTLSDYNESIRIKFHLSYMLGETLIQADKNKFKGGYLTLFKDIKQTKKDYKTIKQLLSDFNVISPTMYNAIADNKEIFIKNFNKIENILKTHKDYQAIIDNIFHNFNYVLKHLDLIQEWLLSDDFYQRYKKENHPYPSLLDPKKLNDENEEINYNNIPAELAWEMNLPLPDNYEFILFTTGASATAAIIDFFKMSNISIFPYWIEEKNKYYLEYNSLKSNSMINIISLHPLVNHKILFLLKNNISFFYISRDPISKMKSGLNHFMPSKKFSKKLHKINLTFTNFEKIFKLPTYLGGKTSPDVKYLDSYIALSANAFSSYIKRFNIQHMYIKSFDDFSPNKAFDTWKTIAKDFGFTNSIPEKKYFLTRYEKIRFGIDLPQTIYLHKNDINKKHNDLSSLNTDGGFNLVITGDLNVLYDKTNIDLTYFFLNSNEIYVNDSRVILYMKLKEYNIFINEPELVEYSKKYIYNYIKMLNNHVEKVVKNMINENDILSYLKRNNLIRNEIRKILNKELSFFHMHYPDIVASWKYYQEFKKMCEELDGKYKIEQE